MKAMTRSSRHCYRLRRIQRHHLKKLVNQLVDNKMVQTVDEIFKLTFQDLVNLERMAEKSAENILNAIESSKQTSFNRFIYALGIRNVGSHLSKVIEKAFHSNINDFMNAEP